MLYAGNGAGLTQENICGGADNKCYVTTRGDGNFKPDGGEVTHEIGSSADIHIILLGKTRFNQLIPPVYLWKDIIIRAVVACIKSI